MRITRRDFLKSIAALAASAAIPIPAFSIGREPYVLVGEVADYIGPSHGGFTGGQAVREIGEWDGVGYPVITNSNCYPPSEEQYYDVDLACFLRELPDRFWADAARKIYPNVHTWLRCKRYGESVEQAITNLNLASSDKFIKRYRKIKAEKSGK